MNLLKKLTAFLVLASMVFDAPLAALAADKGFMVTAPLKNEVTVEDIDAQKDAIRKPNVLFLIESTAAMASTTKGVLPQVWRDNRWDDSYWESGDWELTYRKFGYTIYDINRMMADFTFGMGALPTAWRGHDLRPERNLYGRDVDESNNFKKGRSLSEDIELNKDNYYFPFLEAKNALSGAYSGQVTPLEIGFTNVPDLWPDAVKYGYYRALSDTSSVQHATGRWPSLKIGYKSQIPFIRSDGKPDWRNNPTWYNPQNNRTQDAGMRFEGDELVAYYNYRVMAAAPVPYPYALVFKDPKYWITGWTGSRSPSKHDLVPNDSRMYQTKLVLWNMLNNKDLFKSIRFGMATTFLSPANVEIGSIEGTHYGWDQPRQDINGIFKVDPFASNVRTRSFFNSTGDVYPKGAGKEWSYSHAGSDKVPYGYRKVRYENGAMYGPTTGELEAFFTIHGQYYPVWHNATVHSNYATLRSDNSEPDGWWSGWDGSNNTAGNRQGERSDRPQYKLMNRASLHLPILEYDHKWRKGGKTITHADKFRMWINGLADIRSAGTTQTKAGSKSRNNEALADANRVNQFHYYNDPEIGVAGVFALPQAIFPDPTPRHFVTGKELNLSREYYLSNGWIWYSMRDYNINYRADYRRYSDELEITGTPRARFNSGSGEATGSVLDFFSPPINYFLAPPVTKDDGDESYGDSTRRVQVCHSGNSNRSTVSLGDLDDVSFPIKSTCEDNWLIVIASGSEPKIADAAVYSYSAWEAVKNLYDSTNAATSRDMSLPTGRRKAAYQQVTMMTKFKNYANGARLLKKADLDNPIRTLVIGIVANENDPAVRNNAQVLAEVRRMRLNLVRMAVAGQGGDASKINYNNMYDAPYQPYFADDVATLQIAIRNALTSVGAAQKPQRANGSFVEVKSGVDGKIKDYLSAGYKIVNNNQWEGILKTYRPVIVKDSIVSVDVAHSWELGKNLKRKRDSSGLDIVRWDGASQKFKTLTPGEATAQDIFGLRDRLIVPKDDGRIPYNEALYQWLRGYDYSYSNGTLYPRANMLADFGQSSITVVNKPNPSVVSLPGYHEWSKKEESRSNPPTLYAQTNDGILHVVDPATGDERKTVLLPPVLLPARLATLKTKPAGEGKLMWLDVTAKEGIDGANRSVAGFILDGPLKTRHFSGIAAGGGWGTYLLGTLGRGGNGLYMLDVSDHGDPKFMWYHEKYEDSLVLMPPGAGSPSVTSSAPPDYAAYAKLGYNSPAPVMGVVMGRGGSPGNPGMRNIIALAGGTQTAMNPLKNGTEGAVLLVLNPKDGSVWRAFDGNSLESGFRVGSGVEGVSPYMGMMVSAPALLQTDDKASGYALYTAGRIYAADNRGNIFAVYMEKTGANGNIEHLDPSGWKMRTVATLQDSLPAGNRGDKNYAFPHGMALSKDGPYVWIAGGTSNMTAKKTNVNDPGVISNNTQMIFAFKSSDGQTAPLVRNDIQELPKSSLNGSAAMSPGGKGWYIKLDRINNFDEYVSAKPILVGDTLLVSTFTTTKIDSTNITDICKVSARSISGYSRIYALNLRDGSAALWAGQSPDRKMKYVQLENLRITGLTKTNNNGGTSVLASFESLNDGKLPDIGQKNARYISVMNAIEIKVPGGSKINVTSGDSVIYYWRMK